MLHAQGVRLLGRWQSTGRLPNSCCRRLSLVPHICRQADSLQNDRRQSHSAASGRQSQPISENTQPPASAYVHLPFCKRRCFYCDFPVSVVGSRPEQPGIQQGMQDYINLICQEIGATVKVPGPPLRTVFFGGGTPTLIPPTMLQQILTVLAAKYGIAKDAEVSMESDPGTFDANQLLEYMSLGVNRFSLGVQCFQQNLLDLCGRSHSLNDVYRAIDDIHQAGVQNWSLDLISGLPQLTSRDWHQSLRSAIDANPAHISVYDLQVEAKTPFARWYEPGSYPLPTDEATADMYRAASSLLQQAGYEHYEISNYAKPGFRSQHNLGYWKNDPFYAFGLGAASYLSQRRFSRPRTMKGYQHWVADFAQASRGITVGLIPGLDSMEAESAHEQLLDYVMLRLRLADGVPLEELQQRYGYGAAKTTVETLLSGDLYHGKYACATVIEGQRHVRLTDPEGFLMSNDCISSLFAELPAEADHEPGRQAARPTSRPPQPSRNTPSEASRFKAGLCIKASAAASRSGGNPPHQPANKKNHSAASGASVSSRTGTGVFILLLLNLVTFVLDHQLHLPQIHKLYLDHINPKWWQFITCSFCHASWAHISSNTFLLYVFGKIVEEEEGLWGVWFTYIITAVGASVASYILQPKASVSLGASGAVFGLFAVSVLCKISFNLKKLIECGILGQFVIQQLLQEAMSMKAGSAVVAGHRVGHVAHLGGALAGVMLVYLLSRLPGVPKR